MRSVKTRAAARSIRGTSHQNGTPSTSSSGRSRRCACGTSLSSTSSRSSIGVRGRPAPSSGTKLTAARPSAPGTNVWVMASAPAASSDGTTTAAGG